MLLFNSKALLSQWKPPNAAENFDMYQNLQPHRVVLPAIARHLVGFYFCWTVWTSDKTVNICHHLNVSTIPYAFMKCLVIFSVYYHMQFVNGVQVRCAIAEILNLVSWKLSDKKDFLCQFISTVHNVWSWLVLLKLSSSEHNVAS